MTASKIDTPEGSLSLRWQRRLSVPSNMPKVRHAKLRRDVVDFLILGALEVRTPRGTIPITAPKQQAVLATLLLEANSVVSADSLASRVWDGEHPRAVHSTLQAYIYRLRRLLEPISGAQLRSASAGYSIDVCCSNIDLYSFRSEAGSAREAACNGNLAKAASSFRGALRMWRGEALTGVPGIYFQQESRFLEIERLSVYEELLAAEVSAGNQLRVLPELFRLVTVYPFRETLVALLMRALYGSGRQAEALEAYTVARTKLREELGIEPGIELQAIQKDVLVRAPLDELRLIR